MPIATAHDEQEREEHRAVDVRGQRQAHALVRHGKVVYERYARGTTASTPLLVWSVSRSWWFPDLLPGAVSLDAWRYALSDVSGAPAALLRSRKRAVRSPTRRAPPLSTPWRLRRRHRAPICLTRRRPPSGGLIFSLGLPT